MTCEINLKYISEISESCNNEFSTLPKVESTISYSEFFEEYLLKNKPCIISNISSQWPSTKEWIRNNKPDFSHLSNKYKNFEVTISDCKERRYNANKTEMISFKEFISYWQNYIENGYPEDMPVLYLKDWHLKKVTQENFYTVPQFFTSDWLNEYFSEKTDDDYKFVYMGPKGTWTPFHADVFTSFSWSVNICGKKRWVLFAPGEELFLKDNLGNLPYDINKCEHNRKFFEIFQNPGDAIFVPSGWHHQVWNLEDTISINHNWVNGCNIKTMWKSISENLNAVKKEIYDCKDMDGWLIHCQLMLKTSYGLDFKMFYDFLHHIALKRIKMLEENSELKQFDTWLLGKNHAIFDLSRIKSILELFMKHSDFSELNFIDNNVKTPLELLTNINNIMP